MIEKHGLRRIFLVVGLLTCMRFAGLAADVDKPNIGDQIVSFPVDTVLSGYYSPIKGKVISPFGYRGRHFHSGTDIKLQHGDTVRAAFDGLVTKACPYSGYGNLVILKHPNSIETYYSHLSKCIVHIGDSVRAGQVVGLGGRTGRATTDHLHFEIRFNHVAKNAEKYFDFKNCAVREVMKEKLPTYTLLVKADKPISLVALSEVQPTSTEPSVTADVPLVDDAVVIRKGDTLYSLSKRFGTSVKQLQELNQLEGTNLRIGRKLRIK
jgi:murein DD-endopeptidase MepM/ murein hydrolase activator NlpD